MIEIHWISVVALVVASFALGVTGTSYYWLRERLARGAPR